MLLDAATAFGEYIGYVSAMVEERRQARRHGRAGPNDMICMLVGADEEGVLESNDELTRDELIMFLIVLLVAGNETTRNAISGGMWALDQFPAQWERLQTIPRSFVTMADEIAATSPP